MQRGQQQQQQPAAAPKVAPPEDPELRRTIDAMAPFVARNGPAFEALAAKLNAANPLFGFLSGGRGAEYYRWRVQVRGGEAPANLLAGAVQGVLLLSWCH